MLPAFSEYSPFFSSSSLQASLPSHIASSSPSRSGSQAHKSRDQRHAPNLSFLPPIDKGLFVLLREANLYCSAKTYTAAVSSLYIALQVRPWKHEYTQIPPIKPLWKYYYYFWFIVIFVEFLSMHLELWETKATSQFTGRCPLLTAPFPPLTRRWELLCLICCFMVHTWELKQMRTYGCKIWLHPRGCGLWPKLQQA